MKRRDLGIKGRKGNLPDPLAGPAKVKDTGQSVIIKRGKDGQIVISKPPKLEVTSSDTLSLKMTGPASDLPALDKMLDRFLKQNNLKRADISSQEIKSVIEKAPEVVKTFETQIFRLYLAQLKIAYEFTTLLIPGYFADERAHEISDRLLNYERDSEYPDSFLLGEKFNDVYMKGVGQYFDFNNDTHYLVVLQTKAGLMCHVNLFDLSIYFMVSTKQYFTPGETYAFKNDAIKKEGRFFTFEDILRNVQSGLMM